MLLTIQHLHKAVHNVKEEIKNIDGEFKNQTSPLEYTRIHEELKVNIEKTKKSDNAKQTKKV